LSNASNEGELHPIAIHPARDANPSSFAGAPMNENVTESTFRRALDRLCDRVFQHHRPTTDVAHLTPARYSEFDIARHRDGFRVLANPICYSAFKRPHDVREG